MIKKNMKEVLNEYMIKIKDVEVYHSDKKRNNEYYIERGGKEKIIKDIFGKNERYIKEEHETPISMMYEVGKKILKNNNLTGEDIDMVIVSSQTPEYFTPPMSAILHHKLNIKKDSCFYDINAACMGMTLSLVQCYNMLNSNKNLKRILLLGCDLTNEFASPKCFGYGLCGDLAGAVIIEKNAQVGKDLIETLTYADSKQSLGITCPEKSFFDKETKINNIDTYFSSKTDALANEGKERIEIILKNNNLKIDDISLFCFSQFTFNNVKYLRDTLNISEDKSPYIADKYGYTATTSPFVVLNNAIKENKIKRGDYILFWTAGAGLQGIVTLIKY